METAIYNDPSRRQDFVLIFEVADGNPNGDPDAGNLPRVDPETMQGLVTDVCLKRKVRDYVDATRGDEANFKIYVQNKGIALNTLNRRAYEAENLTPKGPKQKRSEVEKTRTWMCRNFYDIRTFGAVMTTEVNCGQVRGPAQLTFARSVDPIVPLDLSITRVAITREQDVELVETEKGTEGGKVTEMGRKALVPYGLYVGYGFVNPHFAEQTGFSAEDLALFWQALLSMWDLDRSASRGRMACRGLYVFTHDSKMGKAPAHKLFDLVQVRRKDKETPPRSFGDYEVSLPLTENLPPGVTLTDLEG
ncbi:MAG: type I-C CRISPR-associated protein Cas7/Csd2 [Deltaproteobacteria bacterium]|nr:type I-C CRISPR-associated protein Cas7/Csd2 [Deltaproteobacteria bacterium]